MICLFTYYECVETSNEFVEELYDPGEYELT